ncbi:MAG: hypothetical protein AVDCRST_MAG89-2726 [uncultured Gemmatimonadetes bacterium]|uniref:Cell surface glycan-binding lipoprotein, utilization system for glycans and polysaccharides (PUL), SusD family n=1 Tax=uncultured Gemmatimonadota bacterium TaxID=203437 RepID=A0A6J4LVJ5_9BACT|nr:MAG: hypothetical protein AVDCRST_MAG89-2726 [uncultured Gemmatimonadota bacterium]
MRNNGRNGRGFKPLPRLAVIAALTLPLAACDIDELLELPDPDIVDPAVFTDSTTAMNTFRNSAIGAFSVSFDAGGGDNQVNYSGMFADEFINSETFDTRIEIDLRSIEETNSDVQAVTRSLYRARTTIEDGIRTFQRFSPGTSATDPGNVRRAELFALSSMVYMLFGEHYCSGVPFSRFEAPGTFTYGGQETTEQIFTRALNAADSAISIASRVTPANATSTQFLNFGRVMRGRALLNLGRFAEAGAAVAAVPTSFAYILTHSENSGRENNAIFTFNFVAERVSAANREGMNGLPYRTDFVAGDPRVPQTRRPNNTGFDRQTAQWDQLKYAGRTASTALATGIEARLIQAEAQLRANNPDGMLETLNGLRATPQQIFYNAAPFPNNGTVLNTPVALTALTAAATEAGRVDQLFKERAYWMYLTAHRMGDLRRLVRQYGRSQANVFPTGAYHKSVQGGQYGTDVNFPVTVDERGNPEFNGFPTNQSLCLNRNA